MKFYLSPISLDCLKAFDTHYSNNTGVTKITQNPRLREMHSQVRYRSNENRGNRKRTQQIPDISFLVMQC